MAKLSVTLLLIVAAISMSSLAFSYNIHAIFTFGDSIFDAGNNHFINNCSAQADFFPYGSSFFHHPTGRFTNGRTVVDFISELLGIELQKPFLQARLEVTNGTKKGYPTNGINFASAGSGVLNATNQDMKVIPIQDQLNQYQELVNQNLINKTVIEKSLFLFESGSNDIFNYFLPYESPTLDPNAYVQSMLTEASSYLDQIYKLGARRIAIFALGPVGCVPARALLGAPTNKCFGKMNVMVKNYNKGLENLVSGIPTKYPGAIGVFGDVYRLVQRFRAIPTRYGFTDVTNACCGDGTLGGYVQCGREGYKLCEKPKEFLFWDYFHPSEHAYKVITKALWAGKNLTIRPFDLQALVSVPNVRN
ncbi:hypothetical protein ACFE04_018113 [Oxalis oulophora]